MFVIQVRLGEVDVEDLSGSLAVVADEEQVMQQALSFSSILNTQTNIDDTEADEGGKELVICKLKLLIIM